MNIHLVNMLHVRNFRCFPGIKRGIIRYFSIQVKELPTSIALNHFDQFYSTVFKNWPSVRLGLLCPHFYCAFVNVFSKRVKPEIVFPGMDVFNMKDMFRLNLAGVPGVTEAGETGNSQNPEITVNFAMPASDDPTSDVSDVEDELEEYMPATRLRNRALECEEDYSEYYDINLDYKAQLVRYGTIHFPENWDIFYCQRGKFKKFPAPKTDATGLLNYYLMDGASILPVLALDIKQGETVGDFCASPGGKTLAILFGMQFGKLVCNDVSLSRLNKLKTVLNLYLPGTEEWSKKILVSNLNVADWNHFDAFDKILLDVPCTNDRLSVAKDNNNIFAHKRFDERMQIPKLQTSMLSAALKALKPGGSLVYSTCSLSPIQNDGVVHMALAQLSKESTSEYIINDLKDSFQPLQNMFQFCDNCSYGQLVVPFLPLNYGPMYIAKITRNK